MKYARRLLLVLATIIISIILISQALSARPQPPSAADFPKGALVFAQFSDLNTSLKHWQESALRERFESSASFSLFTNRHLATKISERWNDLNNALSENGSINLDNQFIEELTHKQVAIGIYDIGRLDVLFMAPLGQEQYLLSKLAENHESFEEVELKKGLNYFVKDVKVDRERQTQRLCFAFQHGRFLLATNEQLMVRALSNLDHQTTDRLITDPNYQTLIKEIKPHLATIWVDQARLNKDWYFRNYWIMKNPDQLKDIQAGIFDIEERDNEWVEDRHFLTQAQAQPSKIPGAEAQRIADLVPNSLPYLKIESANSLGGHLASQIHQALLDNDLTNNQAKSERHHYYYYEDESRYQPVEESSESSGEDTYSYHSYLGYDYNKNINDPLDAGTLSSEAVASYRNRQPILTTLDQIISRGQPKLIATLQQPEAIDSPLFAEFHKGVIITLQAPKAFQTSAFETALGQLAADSTMITSNQVALSWKTLPNSQTRLLEMPMLGWSLCYTLRGQDLIITNQPEFLTEMMAKANTKNRSNYNTTKTMDNLTIIKFTERVRAFDNIFTKLDSQTTAAYRKSHVDSTNAAPNFFSGNISSLLDVIAPVETITISRDATPGRLHELVSIKLSKSD